MTEFGTKLNIYKRSASARVINADILPPVIEPLRVVNVGAGLGLPPKPAKHLKEAIPAKTFYSSFAE